MTSQASLRKDFVPTQYASAEQSAELRISRTVSSSAVKLGPTILAAQVSQGQHTESGEQLFPTTATLLQAFASDRQESYVSAV